MTEVVKPSLAELTHVGVKGMHWGQHKSQLATAGAATGKALVVAGKATGKAAVTTGRTTASVASYVAHHKAMVAGGVVAATLLHDFGKVALRTASSGILAKAARNREAGRFALKALSSTAAHINYAKMVRGAYKITTL
jgi:hypothetical protein